MFLCPSTYAYSIIVTLITKMLMAGTSGCLFLSPYSFFPFDKIRLPRTLQSREWRNDL